MLKVRHFEKNWNSQSPRYPKLKKKLELHKSPITDTDALNILTPYILDHYV